MFYEMSNLVIDRKLFKKDCWDLL